MLHAGRRTSSAHSLPLTRMLERLGRSALPAGIATALVLAMTTTMALAQMTPLSGNQAALNQLLAELQDPASSRYHQWLTPAEFDARFGRTQAEVQAVREWLQSQGFTVTKTDAREIVASGTVTHAESAFATKIASSGDGR